MFRRFDFVMSNVHPLDPRPPIAMNCVLHRFRFSEDPQKSLRLYGTIPAPPPALRIEIILRLAFSPSKN